jgi:hypothetical protein
MTDRELLELAAKAAGLVNPRYQLSNGWAQTGILHDENSGRDTHLWNPLADDGDALRLAVKLGMEVTAAPLHAYACRFGTPRGREVDVPHDRSDPCAAVRRAIVRAAAEIGRRMP